MALVLTIVLLVLTAVFYHLKKMTWLIAVVCTAFCMQLDIWTPVFMFGSHYIFAAALLCIVILEWKKGNLYIARPTLYFIFTWAIIFVIYLLAYLINGQGASWAEVGIKLFGIIAYVLETVMLIMLIQTLDKEEKRRSLLFFILVLAAINSVFVFLQIFVPEIGIPLTRSLVSSESLERTLEHGLFTRAYGIYTTPVVLGGITLFTLASLTGFALDKEKTPAYFYFIACAIGFFGLLSYTKTSVLGYPLLLFSAVICLFIQKTPMKMRVKQVTAFVLCTLVMFTAWFFLTPEKNINNRNAYINFLGSGITHIFNTRKDKLVDDVRIEESQGKQGFDNQQEHGDDVIIKSAFTIFKENWLLGVGPASVQGEKIYDMQFISLLHNGGILAFLAAGVFYVWLGINALRKKKTTVLLILVVALIMCMAMDVFLTTIYLPFMAFALCLSQDDSGKNLKVKSKKKNETLEAIG
jgi:hypothetical protein